MATTVKLSTQRARRFGGADAVLAAIVISIVAMMIVPLPTWLLDLLLASNLAFSVALLLAVLYVGEALQIAAFPTVLLLTTLVRLALNVSSTRLILLQADAGHVIQAFGGFVVRGNYVVGAVIFLILTIIQFVVIAKGSERVAEVGARFTLDAMPGKQMAIDAELRAGSIDATEARRRRRQLGRESQFYGAMDGAMKFVKGDVIASVLITIINILAGLAIGVSQRGMDATAALKRYGLLTIGDGLVSQIPALVLATAAGILVTRVASEEQGSALGDELAAQLLGVPRALRVAGGFVLLLAVVPGLPALPFLAIGGLLLVVSRARAASLGRASVEAALRPAVLKPGEPAAAQFVPVVVPWAFQVGSELASLLDDESRGGNVRPGIRSAAAAVRELTFRELGVPLPPGRVEVDPALGPRVALLCLREIPARSFELAEVPDADVASVLVDGALPVIRQRAADYLGLGETQALLDQLEQVSPAVVRQVVPKPVTVPLLADVMRRLVEERVSVRDLRAVLEALAVFAPSEKEPLHLTELVRSQLRRALTHDLTEGRAELPVLLLDHHIEEAVRGAIQRTASGSFLTLAPAAARDIVRAIRRALADAPATDVPPVLLAQPDVRRFVRKLVEVELPELRVVSYAELLPEVAVKPVGRATLAATA
ncbi:MAG: FHIPEP family type III secretion protein [Polyangiaceae bacterium]|nr:FHIPEP family type III secretion protein [Polyangiaceae bacterium]